MLLRSGIRGVVYLAAPGDLLPPWHGGPGSRASSKRCRGIPVTRRGLTVWPKVVTWFFSQVRVLCFAGRLKAGPGRPSQCGPMRGPMRRSREQESCGGRPANRARRLRDVTGDVFFFLGFFFYPASRVASVCVSGRTAWRPAAVVSAAAAAPSASAAGRGGDDVAADDQSGRGVARVPPAPLLPSRPRFIRAAASAHPVLGDPARGCTRIHKSAHIARFRSKKSPVDADEGHGVTGSSARERRVTICGCRPDKGRPRFQKQLRPLSLACGELLARRSAPRPTGGPAPERDGVAAAQAPCRCRHASCAACRTPAWSCTRRASQR
eukprot:352555-Chlamydomonas_euryale.AAC.7